MKSQPDAANAPFLPPDPGYARSRREHAGLYRIKERHADSDARRGRHQHATMIGPGEAVRLVTALAAGSAKLERGEPDVDDADLTAALTLIPKARAELDAVEASLLLMARGRGLTWQEIAFGLGLGSAQAARQRYERLAGRAEPTAQD